MEIQGSTGGGGSLKFGQRRREDALKVGIAGNGLIGISGIGDYLDLPGAGTPPVQIFGKGDGQFDFVLPEQLVQFGFRTHQVFDCKVFAGIQPVNQQADVGRGGGREDGCLDIPDFRGDGETEKDDLHDGHADQDQHGAPVAQDVVEFFPDECDKLFHGMGYPFCK